MLSDRAKLSQINAGETQAIMLSTSSDTTMTGQTWLVGNDGQCHPLEVAPPDNTDEHPYRLYRFLTDLEDILTQVRDDRLRLQAIVPQVQRLLHSATWLQMSLLEPNPDTGWNVLTLYDEPFFPLTIQLVVWAPGMRSPVHNHACWGVVALLSGQEQNHFWQRSPTPAFPGQLTPTGDCLLNPGDILCLMPEAIHQVTAISTHPTLSFNLYGETNYAQRFEFDLTNGKASNF